MMLHNIIGTMHCLRAVRDAIYGLILSSGHKHTESYYMIVDARFNNAQCKLVSLFPSVQGTFALKALLQQYVAYIGNAVLAVMVR